MEATDVTPPRKVTNIKHGIFKIEGILTNTRADLFTTMSNETPTADDEHIVLDNNAPGSRPEEPMALIVKSSDIGAKSRLNLTAIKLKGLVKPSKPMKTRYRKSSYISSSLLSGADCPQYIIGSILVQRAMLVPNSRSDPTDLFWVE